MSLHKSIKVVLILLLLNSIAICKNNETISIVSESWEDATNEDGTGFYWDLTRLVFGKSNIEVKHKIYPYKRGVSLTRKGVVDGWIGSYKNEQDFAISPERHIDEDHVYCLCKKENFTGDTLALLKNKKVAWMKGYNYEKYIHVPMDEYHITDRISGIKMLKTDRIDGILDAKPELECALKRGKFNTNNFTTIKIVELKLYMAFANTKSGRRLAQIWDKNIQLLIDSGELKAFYEKYDYSDYPF